MTLFTGHETEDVTFNQGPETEIDFTEEPPEQNDLEVPISGATGPQNFDPPKEVPSALRQFGDAFNKHARGVLGPAYDQAVDLLKIAETMSPAGDIKDMKEGSEDIVEGIRNLDGERIGHGITKMVGGIASLAIPGSVNDIAVGIEKAADKVKSSIGGTKAGPAKPSGNAVTPDESLVQESADAIRRNREANADTAKDLTGDDANKEFEREIRERSDFDPSREIHPPYLPGTKAHDFKASGKKGEYVRVVSPNSEGKLVASGRWLMRREKFEEIIKQPNAREKLRDMFALPQLPTRFSRVNLPEGEDLRVGITNGHREWGRGGAVQYEILCVFEEDWFENPQEIPIAN